MKLYHWSSKLLANYSNGDIIVAAQSADEARAKARQFLTQWIRSGEELETPTIWKMGIGNLWDDEQENELERAAALDLLGKDLLKEPAVFDLAEPILIPGGE